MHTDQMPGIQGNYAKAEPLYERSLALKEKALGPEHPSMATTLNNLAVLMKSQVRTSFSRTFLENVRNPPPVRGGAGHICRLPAKHLSSRKPG